MWSESLLPDSRAFRAERSTQGLERAIEAFNAGEPVLIHDARGREDEIDLVYPAHAVKPADVARLRNDAGGLICVALAHDVAEAFELSFLSDLIAHPAGNDTELSYDERSSFSLTVNHSDVFTGITDNDRARTIAALGNGARDPAAIDFAGTFDTPGHVHLLIAAANLFSEREGHTELGVALAELADVPPAVVVCEMLDDRTGGALSRSSAASYASRNGFVCLDGSTIIDGFVDR